MKKRSLKATFVVATVALTATGSLVAYDRYQQTAFAAANPLLEENLEALADPSGTSYFGWFQYSYEPGPALEVKHEQKQRVTEVRREQALRDSVSWELYSMLDSYSPEQFITENVPNEISAYVKTETKKFFISERRENVPGGTFESCMSQGYTSLSEDGRPREHTYLTEAEYRAEF